MPEGAVYVGRPSRWGNLYTVSNWCPAWRCVELFRRDLLLVIQRGQLDPTYLAPLRGHDLACWCPLDRPCHADVLLELANR
jgi:hypothetical protein